MKAVVTLEFTLETEDKLSPEDAADVIEDATNAIQNYLMSEFISIKLQITKYKIKNQIILPLL
jgi:hypothetical protein